jgi:FKBP-type peptidyl-prolyl cis-trans isomerase
MTIRPPLPRTSPAAALLALLLVAAFALAACDREEPVPDAADVENLRERPVEERALYLAAYELGQQARQQDTTFNVDAFLRGLRAGFDTDSATALPYMIGYQQGYDLRSQTRNDTTLSDDLSLYVAGFREGFEDHERRLTRAEEQAVQEEMQLNQLRQEAATNPQAQAFLAGLDSTRASADSFMTANRGRDSVQVTPSGVQYVVLAEGSATGESPEEGDRVLVVYTGMLADGTVFDSSNGEPVDFEVGEGLIPGMSEALKMMKIGSHWRLYIPPSLGYGIQGVPGSPIGPNAVLIFDVQLVDILEPVAEGTEAPALSEPGVQPEQ